MDLTQRVDAIEKDLTAIKIDVAVIKANGASKSDIAEAKSAIIMWIVSAIFLSQLLPPILKLFVK